MFIAITVNVKKVYVGGNDIGVYLLAGEVRRDVAAPCTEEEREQEHRAVENHPL